MSSRFAWTPEAEALLVRVSRDELSAASVCDRLGVKPGVIYYRMRQLGLTAPRPPRAEDPQPLPKARDGWIPIAHKSWRDWRELDGAPIGIEAARAAVDAGRATMAQQRVDGGFDLLVRMR